MSLRKNRPLCINIIFMIILFSTFIYDFMFKSNENSFRIILVGVTVWIMYIVFKISFLRKSSIAYISTFIFIILAMYFGNILKLYNLIPNYDKILHLISGIIIALIGYVFYLYLSNGRTENLKPMMGIWFSIIFAIAAAGAWEIWEFTTDQLFGFKSQNNSLIDTMTDIICGTVMGIMTNIPIYLHIKGKKIKFIEKLIQEMRE